MTIFEWQRARQPEQKEQRRQAILQAAADLFENKGLEKASLSKIACAAGLSKAAVYRYFESREAIFLHLLGEAFAEWTDEVERHLAPLADSDDPVAVGQALTHTLLARPRLGALGAVTSTILEHNLSEDGVVAFKSALLPLFLRLANALHAALPSLSMVQVRALLMQLHAAQNGLWPMAHPPLAVARALTRPELAPLRADWAQDLEALVTTLLRGALAMAHAASVASQSDQASLAN